MALFTLVFLVIALLLIGAGVAIGLIGCGIAAALLGLGVVSSSFVIGLRSGRPAAGIRAFFLQCGIFTGIPAGAVCAWLTESLFSTYGSGWPVFVYGAVGGAVAGLVVALLLDSVVRRLHLRLSAGATGSKATGDP